MHPWRSGKNGGRGPPSVSFQRRGWDAFSTSSCCQKGFRPRELTSLSSARVASDSRSSSVTGRWGPFLSRAVAILCQTGSLANTSPSCEMSKVASLFASPTVCSALGPRGRHSLSRKHAGLTVEPELLAHISPLGWAHILLTGEYRWPKRR